MSDLPTVTHSCTLSLCCVTLHCYALDDGRRIIDADDFHALLEAWANPECPPMNQEQLEAFARWQAGMTLPPET